MKIHVRGSVSFKTALKKAGVPRDQEAALRAELGEVNSWSHQPATQRRQMASRATAKLNHVAPHTEVSVLDS